MQFPCLCTFKLEVENVPLLHRRRRRAPYDGAAAADTVAVGTVGRIDDDGASVHRGERWPML